MKVKMILPALAEALGPYWRSIKYSLFPPLGLATLAGYLADTDEVEIIDEHVEPLDPSDQPDLVVLEVYITSAHRAYKIADHYRAKGVYVVMGGLHPTALPEECALHADTVFTGPGEDTWPVFLQDYRAGHPQKLYKSTVRTLICQPPVRRDLIKRELYLVPNSIVVSRGCPHNCDFCYKEAFYKGGKSFYTMAVDKVLAEIESLPGKHLFFLDDNLFADPAFAETLFDGMRGMGRVWQAAGTVKSVFNTQLLEKAVESGLSSLFVGFETLSAANLAACGKRHNLSANYNEAIKRLHDHGVMVNASFVFGLDGDDETVFRTTTDWAVNQGIETATFHILTPYPGTRLHERLTREGRITSTDWDLYDTRHAVYSPAGMSAERLEAGYREAYRDFYRWSAIAKGAWTKETLARKAKHIAYAGAWKKMEPVWEWIVRAHAISKFRTPLVKVLQHVEIRKGRAVQNSRHRPTVGQGHA